MMNIKKDIIQYNRARPLQRSYFPFLYPTVLEEHAVTQKTSPNYNLENPAFSLIEWIILCLFWTFSGKRITVSLFNRSAHDWSSLNFIGNIIWFHGNDKVSQIRNFNSIME